MLKRTRIFLKPVSVIINLALMYELFHPVTAYALTGGPSQPEMQSFEPAGTSDMVDIFTGDFNYNIPLVNVDGYPVNISYHAGINMDQEASWVGLGWNINPGNINRSLRGLPDDSWGDEVTKQTNFKDNITYGGSIGYGYEIFGFKNSNFTLGLNLGIFYNNYKGVGYEYSIDPSFNFSQTNSLAGIGFSLSGNTQEGIDVSPSISIAKNNKVDEHDIQKSGGYIGGSVNSRSGVKSLNFGFTLSGDAATGRKEGSGNVQNKRFGGNASGNISFGTATWTPNISTPIKSQHINLNMTIGGAIFGWHNNMRLSGFYSRNFLESEDKEITKKSYGYMFSEDAPADRDVLLDFNREKDMPISSNTVNLPLVNPTFDIFSVSGQGTGGSFRLYRNDFPIYSDDRIETSSSGGVIGVEFGVGNAIHNGLNFGLNFSSSFSGYWGTNKDEKSLGNYFSQSYNYVPKYLKKYNNPSYESSYFRMSGESTPVDKDFYRAIEYTSLVRPIVNKTNEGESEKKLLIQNSPEDATKGVTQVSKNFEPKDKVRNDREIRNSVMSFLSAENASLFGLDTAIKSYAINQLPSGGIIPYTNISRVSTQKKGHHISELTVLSSDGMRYIYGIPAYNNHQVEATFAVEGESSCATGQVEYTPNADDSKNNTKGDDNFFNSVKTPPYAHSYLLTGLISSDYVDLTNNGISDDDFGTAVKFNYSRVHNNFKWRVPFEANKATFLEGKKTDSKDNKGAYVYGEKEIWHLHSVEGKNHIAMFFISTRLDGYGVNGKDGGLGSTQYAYKLDSIILFSKQDFLKNGLNAYHIKTVHFEYDYSLCRNVHNNVGTSVSGNTNKGKLTLKKIYFTYGNSKKSKLSPYKFNYNDQGASSYQYNLKGHDRWGNYSPNSSASCSSTTDLSNPEFPYTTQDSVNAAAYAAAWSLSEIFLPSGGRIKIVYESDDYAYVMDKQAMTMYKIAGFNHNQDYNGKSNNLFNISGIPSQQENNFVFVDFGEPISQKTLDGIMSGIKDLQFTVFADINGKGKYAFVRAYAEVEDHDSYGLCNSNNSAWIKMKKVGIKDNGGGIEVNPISKAIWNYSRLYTPDLVFNTKDITSESVDIRKALNGLMMMTGEVKRMINGFYRSLRVDGYGKRIALQKSWIRLNAKNYKKHGGGHRVKNIKISDNWEYMGAANSEADDFEYGQEYEYTLKAKGDDGIERLMTSGVASYEPSIGGEENPFHLPLVTKVENKLAPDMDYLIDEPYGESFLPGPIIGYRKVTVKNLKHINVKKTATGKQEYEFYTAYDFPSKLYSMYPDIKVVKPTPIASMFYSKELIVASQGYLIELNDMHGKPKSQYTYAENKEKPISGLLYEYQTDEKDSRKLNNEVLTISKNGTMSKKDIGVEIEFAADARHQNSVSWKAAIEGNFDLSLIGIIPFPVFSVFGSFARSETNIKTITTTKVVKRSGVLKRTIAFQEGSSISTENLLYDGVTGNVLISSTQNEFNDNIYNYTYPAHWAYDEGMGPAYKNINLTIENIIPFNDTIYMPNSLKARDYLVPGDECILTYYFKNNTDTKKVITKKRCFVYNGIGNKLNLIDDEGRPIVAQFWNEVGYDLHVIRSGRRNMHQAPIMSLTTMKNPIQKSGGNYVIALDSVLQTSAVEYSDEWSTFCEWIPEYYCDTIQTEGARLLFEFLSEFATDEANYFDYRHSYPTNTIDEETSICVNNALGINAYTEIRYIKNEGFEFCLSDCCLNCKDSLYVFDSITNDYVYFDIEYIKSICPNYSAPRRLLCGLSNGTYYHPIFDSIRNTFDTCIGPKNDFSISNKKANSFEMWLFPCENFCEIEFEFPEKCFNRIIGFTGLYAVSNSEFTGGMIVLDENNEQDTMPFLGKNSCINLLDCEWKCRDIALGSTINPYRSGVRGNWRVKREHAYVGERNYQTTNVNTRKDGTFKTYIPFWAYDNTAKKHTKSSAANWIWASEVSIYSPFGPALEQRDALNRYSSAIYGFNQTLPTAVASNSKYKQILYESFEDYQYMANESPCDLYRVSFTDNLPVSSKLDNKVKHSGKHSLKLNPSSTYLATGLVYNCQDSAAVEEAPTHYKLNPCDCIGGFAPDSGTYVFSAWLKDSVSPFDTTFSGARFVLRFYRPGGIDSVVLFGSGPIIEGWQRVYATFVIPDQVYRVEIVLKSGDVSPSWFDDIRIHPFNGQMKSYAYDQITLRLMAELDENNFATFYEYDLEGSLVRVKKETERGVKTLQESKKSILKNP